MDKSDLSKYVGNRIKQYRKELRLNQQQLADKLNVKNSTLSDYERGKINIDIYTLTQIAETLNVKILDLLPGQKEETSLELLDSSSLDHDQIAMFQRLVNRTKELSMEERKRFIEALKFTIEIHSKSIGK